MNPPLPFKELVKIIASDRERGDVPEYDYIYPVLDELPHTDQPSTEIIGGIVNEDKQNHHDYDNSATTSNYLPSGTVTELFTTTTGRPSRNNQDVDWNTVQRDVTNLLTTTTGRPSRDDQDVDWNTVQRNVTDLLTTTTARPNDDDQPFDWNTTQRDVTDLLTTTTARPNDDDQDVDWNTVQRNVTNPLTTTTARPSRDDQDVDWNFTFSITIALFLLLCLALPCGFFCIKKKNQAKTIT